MSECKFKGLLHTTQFVFVQHLFGLIKQHYHIVDQCSYVETDVYFSQTGSSFCNLNFIRNVFNQSTKKVFHCCRHSKPWYCFTWETRIIFITNFKMMVKKKKGTGTAMNVVGV